MSDVHALLSASDSARWGVCAAALRETRNHADRGSPSADWGTAGHEVGAWCLTNNAQAEDYPHPHVTVDGKDWPVDADMRKCVDDYLEFVRDRIEDGQLLVEQKVAYGTWLFGNEDISLRYLTSNDLPMERYVHPNDIAFGTSDAVILGDKHLRIIDLKTGANPNNKVSADHPQLKLYALGCLYEYEMLGAFEKVTVSICQPRVDHYPEHTYDVAELHAWVKEMAVAARKALDIYGMQEQPGLEHYVTSDKGCQWCKASATCPAQLVDVKTETRDFFAPLADGAKALVPLPPAEIPEERLALAMSLVDRLEHWAKAVRAEVERRLLAGQGVKGYKLVEGRRGSRAWSSKDDAEAQLKAMRLKVDEMYDLSVISPTSAEKLLKDKSPRKWAKLQSLITQSEGKPSVAPESDKRPALRMSGVTGLEALASAEDLV